VKLLPRHPASLFANIDVLGRGISLARKISWDSSTSLGHKCGRLIDIEADLLCHAHWETSSSDTKIASILLWSWQPYPPAGRISCWSSRCTTAWVSSASEEARLLKRRLKSATIVDVSGSVASVDSEIGDYRLLTTVDRALGSIW